MAIAQNNLDPDRACLIEQVGAFNRKPKIVPGNKPVFTIRAWIGIDQQGSNSYNCANVWVKGGAYALTPLFPLVPTALYAL